MAIHGGGHGHLPRYADGPLPVQSRRRRVWRHLRRNGGALAGARIRRAHPLGAGVWQRQARANLMAISSDTTGYLGVDVGTGSVRAAIFDAGGRRLGMGICPIQIFRPEEDFVEQSSDDIWQACGSAVRQALAEAGIGPSEIDRIAGVGFDGTCSLVALGPDDEPVTISP